MKKICIICGSDNFKIKSDKFCSQKCIHKYGSIQSMNTKIKCEICSKEIIKNHLKKHLKKHEEKNNHYFCENCGIECFNKYGSGRFCSEKCARCFSSKEKRQEINKKVSETLKNKYYLFGKTTIKNIKKNKCLICGNDFKYIDNKEICNKCFFKNKKEKICIICGNKFESKKHNQPTCSKKCGHIFSGKNQKGKPHKMVKDTSKMGGLRNGGGKSKQIPYINWLGYKMSLNKEEIKVAQELDNLKLNWKRNTKGFPYLTTDGQNRKYYPDFVIDENIYVEFKGWITDKMIHKMDDAKIKNNLNLIIVVGKDKRYLNMGIQISEIKDVL